jgi:hypothetical protein
MNVISKILLYDKDLILYSIVPKSSHISLVEDLKEFLLVLELFSSLRVVGKQSDWQIDGWENQFLAAPFYSLKMVIMSAEGGTLLYDGLGLN